MKKILCVALTAALMISLTACSPALIRDIMVELDKDDYNDAPSLAEKLDGIEPPQQTAEPFLAPQLPVTDGRLLSGDLDPLGLLYGEPITASSDRGFEKQDGSAGTDGIYRKDITAPYFADATGENYAEILEQDGATVFASYYYDITVQNSGGGLYDFINNVEDVITAQLGAEKSDGMLYLGGEEMDYAHTGRLTEQEAERLAAGDSEGYGYTMYGGSWAVGTDMLDVYFSVMNGVVKMNIMRGYGDYLGGAGDLENAAELPSMDGVAGGYEFSALGADNPRPITTAEQIAADPGVKTGSSVYSQFMEYTKPMDIMGRQGELYVAAEGEKIYTMGYKIDATATDTPEDMARLYSDMGAFAEEIAARAPDEALRDDAKPLDFAEVLTALQKGEDTVFATTWQMEGYTLNAMLTVDEAGSTVSLVYYFD